MPLSNTGIARRKSAPSRSCRSRSFQRNWRARAGGFEFGGGGTRGERIAGRAGLDCAHVGTKPGPNDGEGRVGEKGTDVRQVCLLRSGRVWSSRLHASPMKLRKKPSAVRRGQARPCGSSTSGRCNARGARCIATSTPMRLDGSCDSPGTMGIRAARCASPQRPSPPRSSTGRRCSSSMAGALVEAICNGPAPTSAVVCTEHFCPRRRRKRDAGRGAVVIPVVSTGRRLLPLLLRPAGAGSARIPPRLRY